MARFRILGRRGMRAPGFVLGSGPVLDGDAIEVRFDVTRMTKRDALQLLDEAKAVLIREFFPIDVNTDALAGWDFSSTAPAFDNILLTFDRAA